MSVPPRRVAVAPDVVFRPVAGEAVILDLGTQCYFSLDETGARMWQLLAEHGDTARVVERMAGEYDVRRETLERDLERLVEELLAAGLLRVAE